MRFGNVTIKDRPRDFEVREVACLPEPCPPADASHTYLSVTKQGISTFDAARRVARALGLEEAEVRWLGLKDEDGVTTQLLSVAGVLHQENLDELSRRLGGEGGESWISIDRLLCHSRAHAPRHLLVGNAFKVVLRGIDPAQVDRIGELCAGERLVFPNYYDRQRFGVIGSDVLNSHLIGERLAARDPARAYAEFLRSGNSAERKRELIRAFEGCGDHQRAFAALDPRLVQFLLDAAASFRWNAALSETLARSGPVSSVPELDGVQDLNLCWLDDRPLTPVLTVPSTELVADPLRQSLPLRPAVYRRLTVQPVKLHSFDPIASRNDVCSLRLEFFLPTGAYATMLLRYLVHQCLQVTG